MKWTPRLLRWALNLYGPYLGAGIRVTYIDPNWREIVVKMKLRWFNRNIVGTHFGGSLYAMVDPQMMLMLMKSLGSEYIVWDSAAEIVYLKPAKGEVSARFILTEDELREIKAKTAEGAPYKPEFLIEIKDAEGAVVTRVKKVLYVRKKPQTA
jgi:acyl-coenzyme A thioesterase PaaI-like protein